LPIGVDLFMDVAKPLNSLVLTGNPGLANVSYRTDRLMTFMVGMEWDIGILLIYCWLKRRGWIMMNVATASDTNTLPTHPIGGSWFTKYVLSPTMRCILLICLGVLLTHAGRIDAYWMAARDWSSSVAKIQRGDIVDLLWFGWLFSDCILSPLAQEILFRRIIYGYSARKVNVSFGLTFSSIVFAGVHIHASDSFAIFFLAGTVFAIQYQITRRLTVSIATHMIGNLLGFLYQFK
jgi:membrane protease YdiL (CAAX protease family)